MDVSLLNVKITFQEAVVEPDEIGNRINTWKDYYTCHATVSGENGSEQNTAGQTVEEGKVDFTIRYCKKAAGIDSTGFRILFQGEFYDILGVDHKNYKKKCLKYSCRKVRR